MAEQGKICSFFGHSEIQISHDLQEKTFLEIQHAIQCGCRIFLFGGFGMFDALCYKIVSALQKDNPSLALKRVFCVPQERYLRKKAPFFQKEDYDETVYLSPAFGGWYKSIYFRNCAMIDKSDYVIFYAEKRENSGAYKAYAYASKKRKK